MRLRVRRYWSPQVWFGGPAVLVAAIVGLLTSEVARSPTLPLSAGFAAGVLALVALSVRQGVRDQDKRLADLRTVLESFEPLVVDAQQHTVSSLLAASSAVARFVGRGAAREELVSWCLDRTGSRIWVLAGPAGVGKSRLAVEVARALPDRWLSGRVVSGRVAGVIEKVLAYQEPTLIVVDDAEIEADVVSLVRRVVGLQGGTQQVKVLLVVRDGDVFGNWLRQRLPDELAVRWPMTSLTVIGERSDRSRWFAHAAWAYAEVLDRPCPPVSDRDTRPVGTDGEPMMVTQARAVLVALGDGLRAHAESVRITGTDTLADGLFEHERKRWNQAATDARWCLPADLREDAREAALLSLVLLAPGTGEEAVRVLRRVGLLHNQDKKVLSNVVAWAHHLYPGDASAKVTAPGFVAGVILSRAARPDFASVVDGLKLGSAAKRNPEILIRLVRVGTLFPTVATLVAKVLEQNPEVVSATIEYVMLTGLGAKSVQSLLVSALATQTLPTDEVSRLLELVGEVGWPRLRVALHQAAVRHARNEVNEVNEGSSVAAAALAQSLDDLGASLWEVGEYRRSITVLEEAVSLWRGLVAKEPARHTANLARSLINLGATLGHLGRHDEELTWRAEAVARWWHLSQLRPGEYKDVYDREQARLGRFCSEHGYELGEALRAEQDAVRRCGLKPIHVDTSS
jgi:Tetratricopeptide repeat